MKNILTVILLSLAICKACDSKREIDKLLKSEDKTDQIRAFYLIGENKDIDYIDEIFKDPYDPRISHDYKFLGISVYQSKMVAMRKISGKKPPREITYQPDTLVVNFYLDWAKKNKYM